MTCRNPLRCMVDWTARNGHTCMQLWVNIGWMLLFTTSGQCSMHAVFAANCQILCIIIIKELIINCIIINLVTTSVYNLHALNGCNLLSNTMAFQTDQIMSLIISVTLITCYLLSFMLYSIRGSCLIESFGFARSVIE